MHQHTKRGKGQLPHLTLRLSREELNKIKIAAMNQDMTTSEYVRFALKTVEV